MCIRDRVDAVGLNGAGDADQILVDHGNKGDVVLLGEVAEDLVEGVDVVGAVVGGQGDAGEQYLDMRGFEGVEHLVQVAACQVEGQAAESCLLYTSRCV